MKSEPLLLATAALYLLLGVGLLFLPVEAAGLLGLESAELAMQMAAAGLIGFGWMNWAGRRMTLGGIYARPLVLGNFAFAIVVGASAFSAAFDGRASTAGWVLASLFAGLAGCFYILMRTHPTNIKTPQSP